jgi:Serine carboxypeptidase
MAGRPSNLPLCDQFNTETYMNRPDVRTALHIPDFLGSWAECK